MTRGPKGAFEICGNKISECPAFVLSVKDTVGAGDAFFAIAGIFAAAGAPMEIGTFMGNISGIEICKYIIKCIEAGLKQSSLNWIC